MFEALRQIAAPGPLGEESIQRVLGFARTHLGMDLAWITRAVSSGQIVEFLHGDGDRFGLRLGALVPTFTRACRPAAASAIAPLVLPDGRLYGHLACLAETARPELAPRDQEFLELVAVLVAPSISALDAGRDQQARVGARIQAVLDQGGPRMVYQPIWALRDRGLVAYEALARFPHGGPATPDVWFEQARDVGLGTDLEVAAVRGALSALPQLPPTVAISVNVSAGSVRHPAMLAAIAAADPARTIVEITEHEHVEDYQSVRASCEDLKDLGCVIAVDDAGAGYAGFQHLVEIRPDIIKLDLTITRNLDRDPARAAMATALLGFASAIDATVLAEGVETSNELRAATALGVHYAQGYHLGRPQPLPGHALTTPTSPRIPDHGVAAPTTELGTT
jgi:EAL domain-containing protein (putative c-di-GMP-specific phosphodiesterase class I)